MQRPRNRERHERISGSGMWLGVATRGCTARIVGLACTLSFAAVSCGDDATSVFDDGPEGGVGATGGSDASNGGAGGNAGDAAGADSGAGGDSEGGGEAGAGTPGSSGAGGQGT